MCVRHMQTRELMNYHFSRQLILLTQGLTNCAEAFGETQLTVERTTCQQSTVGYSHLTNLVTLQIGCSKLKLFYAALPREG